MKDNLQYNNLPGAELEQLSKEMAVPPSPTPQDIGENTESSNPQSVLSDNISAVSQKPADNTTSASPRNSYPHPQNTDPNFSSPLINTFRNKLKNNSQPHSGSFSKPQNGDPNSNPPRINTLRNKFKADSSQTGVQNSKPQNTDPRFNYPGSDTQRNKFRAASQPGDYSTASPRTPYPHPQNTDPNINPPRTNTFRNKFKNDAAPGTYPNPRPQNTDPNFNPPRTNTLRNKFRNDSPPGGGFPYGRPQNGYPYPQNNDMRYNMPGNNSFDYRNGYRPNSFYNSYPYPPYRPNNYSGNQYSNPNMNYGYYQPNYYPGAYNTNPPYPPYTPPAPSPNVIYPQNQYNRPYSPFHQPFFNELNQKELQRLELSKDCSRAGTATIAIFIVMFVVAIIIEVIAVMCGVSHDLPDIANDPYAGFTPMGFYMYTGLTSLLSIFLPALILMRGSGRKISELVPFKPIEGKKLAAIVMCGMSLCMVAQLMASLIQINFSLFGIDIYKGLETATATGFFDVLMSIICTAIIPALVEEFAFRGLVAGLLKRHDEMLAVFGSAFLFGMLHGNFAQIPFAFTVGLILGYVRVKTDSMLPGILIHFGNNLYAVIITELDESLPAPYSTIADVVTILILVAIGFVCANYLIKNHKDFFKLKKEKSLLTYKEKLSAFLKAGTVRASFVLLTIMSFVVLFAV